MGSPSCVFLEYANYPSEKFLSEARSRETTQMATGCSAHIIGLLLLGVSVSLLRVYLMAFQTNTSAVETLCHSSSN